MAHVTAAAVVTLAATACAPNDKPIVLGRIVATPLHTKTPVPSRHRMPRQAQPVLRARPVPHPQPDVNGQLVQMSWYAEGSGTASGEAFNPSALTCAGASRFKMLSHWRLSNPRTRASAVIRVTDRGAFEGWGRSFDCTPAVWRALGFALATGVVTVEARPA